MEYRIENCAGSAESARRAQLGGAYRIELCAGLPEGGTTPSYGEIVAARRAVDIKLNVIIRPRAGDFLYTPLEVEAMLEDIKMARQIGVDGIVVGCLTPDGEVDKPLLRRFVEASGDLPVTFHRAIDVCRDPSAALEDIIEAGCARVLTSGGRATALEGAEVIAQLVRQAGDRIIIMPGAGVTPENIAELAWPDRKVAVLMPSDQDGLDNPDREKMTGMGWTVFVASSESVPDELLALLKNY